MYLRLDYTINVVPIELRVLRASVVQITPVFLLMIPDETELVPPLDDHYERARKRAGLRGCGSRAKRSLGSGRLRRDVPTFRFSGVARRARNLLGAVVRQVRADRRNPRLDRRSAKTQS